MHTDLIILFGLPGVGKSFIANILKESFGYTSHNGDDDIPSSMKEALHQKLPITDAMRKEFTGNLIQSVEVLKKNNNKLVVHQTLIKEFMREALLQKFPRALFILVSSDPTIREQRYMNRTYFNLGLSYLRQMSALFDPPRIPHEIIINEHEGREAITSQLQTLL